MLFRCNYQSWICLTEEGFEPISNHFIFADDIVYEIELGVINRMWASRLLENKKVIDYYVYQDEDLDNGFPNQNVIVGWVLRTLKNPNINPHRIMKITQALVQQALGNKRNGFSPGSYSIFFKPPNPPDDFAPTPYIFKPPEPPDDLVPDYEVNVKRDIDEEDLWKKPYCKRCGSFLPEGASICPNCGSKDI